MSWDIKTLGDLLTPSGSTRAGKQDYPVLSITMHEGLVDQAQKFKKRVASADTSKYKVVFANELVVGFPIDEGVVAFQTQYPAALVSPAYSIWRLKHPADTHVPYVESYLRSVPARELYASKVRGSVARRRTLTRSDFLSIEVPFPPLAEQKRISVLLDRVDALRLDRKRSIQLSQDLIQSVFVQMFGDPLTNPRGLPLKPLTGFGTIKTGNTPPRNRSANFSPQGIEWIKPDNIHEDHAYVSKAREKLSVSGERIARIAPAGSLLVVCIAGSDKSIGRTALTDRDVAFNQQINSITPNAATSPLFLYHMLKIGRNQIQRAAAAGMKRMVSKSIFGSLRFIAPSSKEQKRFEGITKTLLNHMDACRLQLLSIEELNSALRRFAFQGKLNLADSRHIVAPPNIEEELSSVEDEPGIGPADYIPWNEDYFRYRILGQLLRPPYSFERIWQSIESNIEEVEYETVKSKMFEYVAAGILEQQFDEENKEIVFVPRP